MGTEYILELKHISKSFPGVKALDDVTLCVRPGTVHSLMGENGAGKSTLMKCLFGIYSFDEGEIILDGKNIKFSSPSEALQNHVSMVHQELNQVLNQTVMENMWLGRFPMKHGLVDDQKMYEDTKAIFDDLDIQVNPKVKIGTLKVSQKQMIEIAKAVSYNSKVIVMDEPTSSLTEKEVEHLFKIIEKLKKKNTSIIYISHKMEEILRISDDVTVMRDGKWIDTKPASELTIDKIIKMMVGRELKDRYPEKKAKIGDVLMEVKDLGTLNPGFEGVNFQLHKGEILGIAGLVGSKRTEILETLFGIRMKGKGQILVKGKEVQNRSPKEAMANGFAMLTEERRSDGIFGGLSVGFNMTISNLPKYQKTGLLNGEKMKADITKMINAMKVKTPSMKSKIANLSGGNQQKVILGRWLLTDPDILLLDEPTRGIDVGAKFEIYQLINQLAEQGKGIIVVSSEMPELFGISDRILVMSNGHQSAIFDSKEVGQVDVMQKIVVLGVLGDTENIGDHGSSKVHPYYTVTPFKGLMKKMPKAQILYNDGSDLERAKELAADADAVVIVAGYIHSDEGEYLADRSDIAGMGGDRASMRLHQRDIDLIHGVKGVNPNTVVSIIGSSAILIDEWEKDVPAIIFSFYSGMEGGNVLADILFGDVCPSGKLPYTVALSEDSYPDFDPDCTYAEYEYYHGYCKMDKENIPVLYPFGYGLSYTTFDISEPTVEVFDKTAKISVNVKNTGDVKGAEVVQLYIGCEGSAVDRPVKILKDFARVELMPGEEKKVSLQVSSKDMAYYSEEKDDFVEEDITYIAYTGDCSCKEALKSVKFEFGK